MQRKAPFSRRIPPLGEKVRGGSTRQHSIQSPERKKEFYNKKERKKEFKENRQNKGGMGGRHAATTQPHREDFKERSVVLAVADPWASASFDLSSQSLADVSGEFYVDYRRGRTKHVRVTFPEVPRLDSRHSSSSRHSSICTCLAAPSGQRPGRLARQTASVSSFPPRRVATPTTCGSSPQ